MAIQTVFSEKSMPRQLPGLILPQDFNSAAGNIAQPSGKIWTPDDQNDGYSLQGGILQKDAQVYVPQRLYFFPSQVSVSARKSATPAAISTASASAAPVSMAETRQSNCFNLLDGLLLEEQQESAEQKRDMHWFGRLSEAVVQGINDERATMGLPTLQDEAAKRHRDFH